jgi:hypothetical protein
MTTAVEADDLEGLSEIDYSSATSADWGNPDSSARNTHILGISSGADRSSGIFKHCRFD